MGVHTSSQAASLVSNFFSQVSGSIRRTKKGSCPAMITGDDYTLPPDCSHTVTQGQTPRAFLQSPSRSWMMGGFSSEIFVPMLLVIDKSSIPGAKPMHEDNDVGYGPIALPPRTLTCIRQIICASITILDPMDSHHSPHAVSPPIPPSRGTTDGGTKLG